MKKDKEFSYKLFGYSVLGIIFIILILFLNLKLGIIAGESNSKKNNEEKIKCVIDSTWIEFPNTVTKTTPRYFSRTNYGNIFYTSYKKYESGDTIEFILK